MRAGDATIRFVAPYPGIPRLWFVYSDRPLEPIVAAQGTPIHYGYVPRPLSLEAYQSLFSRVPGSAEMPSASRPITPRIREALEDAGHTVIEATSFVSPAAVPQLADAEELLRALAVALLVFAFSRPFFGDAAATTTDGRARALVLMLDRSMSMGHTGTWAPALDSARATVRALESNDHVAIVLFDEEASVVQDWTRDHATALAALDGVAPVSRSTRMSSALRAARGRAAAAWCTLPQWLPTLPPPARRRTARGSPAGVRARTRRRGAAVRRCRARSGSRSRSGTGSREGRARRRSRSAGRCAPSGASRGREPCDGSAGSGRHPR